LFGALLRWRVKTPLLDCIYKILKDVYLRKNNIYLYTHYSAITSQLTINVQGTHRGATSINTDNSMIIFRIHDNNIITIKDEIHLVVKLVSQTQHCPVHMCKTHVRLNDMTSIISKDEK